MSWGIDMVGRSSRRTRGIVALGACVLAACTLVAVTGPVHAATRPAPTHLRATTGQTAIAVRWHRVRKAPGYRVRWSVRRSMTHAHHLATTRNRTRIGGLAPDTRYFVQVAVAAHRGQGRRLSDWSRRIVRRTPPTPCPTRGNLGDPTPAAATGLPTDLRVATFNIRTITLDSATYPEQRWRSRAARVASLLLGAATTRNPASAAPDVIALQEANQSYARFAAPCTNQMIDLRNRLNASGRHYEATSLAPSASVGTRILFDTARLRLEASGAALLAPSTTTHPHLAWAIFQERSGGQQFFFGSVHLVPNESGSSTATRNAEWDRLLALLADPALTRGLPVLLGGDFNARRSDTTNDSALLHLPRMYDAGVGDALLGDLDPADRNLTVNHARPDATLNAECRTTNGFRRLQHCEDDPALIGQHFDYLFADNDLRVRKWEVVLDLDEADNWLGTIPSDHNLVRATVTLPGTAG